MSENKKKLFDFAIGNPPYQNETIGQNKSYAPPIYHEFMDASYQLSSKSLLIHPARFLFNAGSTPKDWNKKMLSDEHFTILEYQQNSKEYFQNTDIKGGVAISYRDDEKTFGAIEHFIAFKELREIMKKAYNSKLPCVDSIIYAAESFKFTDKMHEEHPEIESILSQGHKYDFKSSVFDKLAEIVFFEERPNDEKEYVQILGIISGKRTFRWIQREYIKETPNFTNYKVFLPNANGSGALGEVFSTPLIGQPLIGQPLIGHTQTFISIGNYQNKQTAENLLKYIKTKFARTMLGILKVTQNNPRSVWKYVPLQDFTENSDIDWSKSVAEIDQQLYKKYNLSPEEIAFIEEKVKEME